jgi:hypothetical protein
MGAAKKLAYRVAVPDENGEAQWYGPDDTVPAAVAKQITNPSAWADSDGDPDASDDAGGSRDGGDGSDKAPSYSSMKKADLEAEVASRNEGRAADDIIEVEGKGTVADLVAALEADDAANADA